ncbi:MAG: pitrilysin family protein [Nostocoides sp.]
MSAPRPDIAPAEPWAFPVPQETLLDNGIRLLTFDIPGQYVVSVRVAVPTPLSAEPGHLEGIATIMARLLDEGTTRHTPEEFAELLERKGIGLGTGMTESALMAELDVAARHLGDALDLLRQMLAEPAFPEAEVRRAVATRKAEIEQERASAPHRAGREFVSTFYDPADRASRPTAGSSETVGAITRDDVVAFHAENLGPRGATVIVAGDFTGLDVAALVGQTLGVWSVPGQAPAVAPVAARRATDAARIVAVDRPGSVQTEFAIGWSGPDRHTQRGWAAYQVLSFVIGGSPTARIDAVLREDKGYTYGIRSAFRPRRVGGTFFTSGSVRTEVTVDALQLLLGILDLTREGFTADELRDGVDYISKTAPGRFATADAVAGEAATLALDGLATDFTTTNLQRMATLTTAELDAAIKAVVTGEWTVVVVGDAAAWLDGLRDLGRGEVTVVPN